MALRDPRFTTTYAADYRGPLLWQQNRYLLPAAVNEVFCTPGYQPKRPNKGVKLLVNNLAFQPLQYGGPGWYPHVYTPFLTYN